MPRADTSSWPYSTLATHNADSSAPGFTDALLGLGNVFEAQARLWNHLLDANRSFWDVMSPWMQGNPWLLNNALAVNEEKEKGLEPAETADGIPDAFEAQARSWNHFLDAHRSFWTSMAWPVPAAPWLPQAAEDGEGTPAANAAGGEPEVVEPRKASRAPTKRSAATKGAARKSSR